MAAACAFLFYRLWPDVMDKPFAEDEAVAGLISMRPLGEVLETVMVDRGGAPLHFVLAHAVFLVEASADALRWLSVAAALAAVPLCFDLGRRLAGTAAGIVAAAVVASSTAFAVYGSFGRMYALFVLVAALAADLFVRALQRTTTGTIAAAAGAAWLLPAVHPYGAIPAGAMLLVGFVVWRRQAWPFGIAAVAAVPFLVADLRLADRAQIGSGRSAVSPGGAWEELSAALSSFAGGAGFNYVWFSALALVGLTVLGRERPAVAALAATIAVPPLLLLVLPAGSEPDLSPRHLFYGLPLWAAAIGVGVVWLRRRVPYRAWIVLVAAVCVQAAYAPPSAIRDPRELGLLPPEARMHHEIVGSPRILLFPYATPFLAELDSVTESLALPQGPSELIVAALEHAPDPVSTIEVASPARGGWALVTTAGPIPRSLVPALVAESLAGTPHPKRFDWWYRLVIRDLCEAAAKLGRRCVATLTRRGG